MDDKEFGELLQMVKDTRSDVKEIKRDIKAQNGRVRRLEIKWGYMAGIGAVLVIAVPLLIRVLF
ncbi:MAG: hypothetical protein DRP46_12430 [Candidatus Zixiibacteriota bacterium]|nr:MAG: hypothetical protein DRP46_12430 [candidate division Zixibacteria bacterium]